MPRGGRRAPATADTEFMSFEECARFFGVSRPVIQKWYARGLFAEHDAAFAYPGGAHRKIVRFHRANCEKMRASFLDRPIHSVPTSRGQRNTRQPGVERF